MHHIIRSLYGTIIVFIHIMRDYYRLLGGVWRLSKLDAPIVSVFGGSKIDQDHPYAREARMLSQKLLNAGYSVITGGGPGIMMAANCGLFNSETETSHGISIGVGVEGLSQEVRNQCADIFIVTRYFFTRKYLLTRFSNAFIVFPGGYGTADELFEILTLMQTEKLRRLPVILIGTAYWKPLTEWVEKARTEKLLLEEDAALIFVTDDSDHALRHVEQHCQDHFFHS